MELSLERRSSERGGRRPITCEPARVEELARELPNQSAIAARLGMGRSTLHQKLKTSPNLRRAYERGRGVRAAREIAAAARRRRALAAKRARAWDELEDGGINAGLYLLGRITPRGVTLTQDEIAFVCGCSKGYIYLLEKTAMQKLREGLVRHGIDGEFL